jgi:hypothetical protein
MFDLIAVDLLARIFVYHDEFDTRRGCDRSAVLVAKAAHARALRLLHNNEFVYPAIFIIARIRFEVDCLLSLLVGGERCAILRLGRFRQRALLGRSSKLEVVLRSVMLLLLLLLLLRWWRPRWRHWRQLLLHRVWRVLWWVWIRRWLMHFVVVCVAPAFQTAFPRGSLRDQVPLKQTMPGVLCVCWGEGSRGKSNFRNDFVKQSLGADARCRWRNPAGRMVL